MAECEPILLSYRDKADDDGKAYSIDDVLGEGAHIACMVKKMNQPVQVTSKAKTKRFTKCQIATSLCAVVGFSALGIGLISCYQHNYCNDVLAFNLMRQSTSDLLAQAMASISVNSEKRVMSLESGFDDKIKD